MSAALVALSGWLLTVSLHGLLWAALGLLTAAVLRRRALGWQELTLRLCLLGGLVTGTAQWSTGGPLLAWPAVPAPAAPSTTDRAEPDRQSPWPAGADAAPIASFVAPTARPAAATVGAAAGSSAGAPPVAAAVLVGSAAGMALLGLLGFAATRRRLARCLRDRRPEQDPRVLAIAAQAARDLGLRHTPHLSRSPRLASPLAFSLLRPEVCLPERIGELGDDELQALFGHELAHVQRGDAVWLLLGAGLQALFPWHVWLWALRRRLCEVAELRCDAVAASRTSGVAVANCLVQVATWVGRTPRGALAMAPRPSLLRQRVEHVLAGDGGGRTPRLLAAATTAGLLLLFTAAAPGVRRDEATDPDGAWRMSPMPASRAAAGAAERGAAAGRVGGLAGSPAGAPAIDVPDAAPRVALRPAERLWLQQERRALRSEREQLVAEARQLRASLAATEDETTKRMLDLLEVQLAELQRTGDRVDAALERMEKSGAPGSARRSR